MLAIETDELLLIFPQKPILTSQSLRAQNAYFSESWKKRESGVLFWKNCGPVIWPALLLSELVGAPRVGWFSRLNASARN